MTAFVYRIYSINQRIIFIFNLPNNAFYTFDIKFVAQKHLNDKMMVHLNTLIVIYSIKKRNENIPDWFQPYLIYEYHIQINL